EANDWWQFTARDRTGYIVPNPNMIALLTARNDPRLDKFFTGFNAAKTTATNLNLPGKSDYDQPFVTCSETQFIIAEAALHAGSTTVAQNAYEAGLACQMAAWGITLTPQTPVTMAELMTAKYIALFLNPEIWNDYKRTCYPQVVPPAGAVSLAGHLQVPPGFYYPISERQTNTNIPENDETVLRKANDPNRCTYSGVN
ncbi:MAG TPA: SusD/RagB family nutrient-binding outer membrane lipoprotein, partial [Longimicrobiales bacterium]|nr:SusD/RagB family nutrient-binding outer membrane lipoprotein [Longimicrobiales bacterium]